MNLARHPTRSGSGGSPTRYAPETIAMFISIINETLNDYSAILIKTITNYDGFQRIK